MRADQNSLHTHQTATPPSARPQVGVGDGKGDLTTIPHQRRCSWCVHSCSRCRTRWELRILAGISSNAIVKLHLVTWKWME